MPFARYLAAAGLLLGLGLAPLRAAAIVSVTDDIELEGFFKTQNILRTPMFRDAEFVMQRNTAQLESKYYFLRNSRAFNRFATGPLEEATLTLIGRGVYDSIYDIRDTYSEAFDKHEKLNRKFEYKLREAFVDLVLPPFTLRLGRQQVVWGETDNFRALDVINPLDLRWHANWEPWEDIRIPLWMARGIYDIGKFGPLEESFVEAVWIPWDFQPNKFGADPRRPWPFIGDGPLRGRQFGVGRQRAVPPEHDRARRQAEQEVQERTGRRALQGDLGRRGLQPQLFLRLLRGHRRQGAFGSDDGARRHAAQRHPDRQSRAPTSWASRPTIPRNTTRSPSSGWRRLIRRAFPSAWLRAPPRGSTRTGTFSIRPAGRSSCSQWTARPGSAR